MDVTDPAVSATAPPGAVSPGITPPGAAPSVAAAPRRKGVAVWLAMTWLVIIVAAAATANLLPLPSPDHLEGLPGQGISPSHWLGTDALGRDELARLVFGARVSLLVGFGAAAIAVPAGLVLGLIAGYFRGWADAVIGIVLDTLLAFPALVFAFVVVTFIGPGIEVVLFTLALFGMAPTARVVRGATIRATAPEYVLAARLLGATPARVIRREVLPGVAIAAGSFGLIVVAINIAIEAALSFFGIAVRPPTPSWGGMIYEASGDAMAQYPMLIVYPTVALILTVISLNLVADFLQGRYDIREGRL